MSVRAKRWIFAIAAFVVVAVALDPWLTAREERSKAAKEERDDEELVEWVYEHHRLGYVLWSGGTLCKPIPGRGGLWDKQEDAALRRGAAAFRTYRCSEWVDTGKRPIVVEEVFARKGLTVPDGFLTD